MIPAAGKHPRFSKNSSQGVALVLALSALALLSFLVLAVLTMTKTEDRSAKASADILDTRTLSDLPAQLVISQLRRATSNLGAGYTWASQPGMLRVFGTTVEDGSPRAALQEAYKLYSSDRMVVQGGDFDPAAEAAKLQNWKESVSLFTYLNEPMLIRPIIKTTPSSTPQQPKLVYPILDPAALNLVEGFKLKSTAPGATSSQPVPMPVAWLYVLQDGRVLSPVSGSGTTASFSGTGLSEKNPIVARIAFWTDDEGCKINLNTAGEPAPWESPRLNSKADHSFAQHQPARNEFHRQSGHPAFTALSPVFSAFGKLRPGTTGATGSTGGSATAEENAFTVRPDPAGKAIGGSFAPNTDSDASQFRDYVESNLRLAPRSPDHTNTINRDRGSRHGTQPPSEPVRLKQERLYSTIDDLIFDTSRKAQTVHGDGLQTLTVTEDDVRLARFFLTTRNAAPETNLFNRPKISLWPVQENLTARSNTDKKLCAAATLGDDHRYFWQRAGQWDGPASPGSSQSGTADLQNTRNAQLIGYLQSLTDQATPGYGGSLAAKLGDRNRDQVLVSMFDLLRSGVNGESTNSDDGAEFRFLAPSSETANPHRTAAYSAVPLRMGSGGDFAVKGYGRFPTITEAAIVFTATDVARDETSGNPSNDVSPNQFYNKTKKVRAFLVLEPFVVAPGAPAVSPLIRYRVTFEAGKDENGNPQSSWYLDAPKNKVFETDVSHTNRVSFSPNQEIGGKVFGGNATAYTGLESQFLKQNGEKKELGLTDEDSQFPFVTFTDFELNLSSEPANGEERKIKFVGGDLKIEILSGADDATPVQTLHLHFPDIPDLPMPLASAKPEHGWENKFSKIETRFAPAATDQDAFAKSQIDSGKPRLPLIRPGDVVRSVEFFIPPPDLEPVTALARHADDIRLLASISHVDPPDSGKKVFFPHFDYFNTGKRYAHSFRSGAYRDEQYGFTESLAEPQLKRLVDLGPSLLPPPGFAGDWDNGPGIIEDGPYVSRPDFNNTANEEQSWQGGPASGIGGYFSLGGDFASDDFGVNTAPLRQIASGIAFGSIPSRACPAGGQPPQPWRTLLFCPHPASRTTAASEIPGVAEHIGFANPPDHTWLEFFWMPVTEPRLLSPGFATEGKVNLNCQILPFSYISRTTALHAALRGVRITAIPKQQVQPPAHKNPDRSQPSPLEFRYPVNAAKTIEGFEAERFAKGDIFRSPSEICEMFLVPKRFGEAEEQGGSSQPSAHNYGPAKAATGLSHDQMMSWWRSRSTNQPDGFEATGDNLRESPYAQLYPRLATRSNVFQVHYRVQLLRKSRTTASTVWDDLKDQVMAEHRGSTVLERYLDPADKEIPDFAAQSNSTESLDDYYRYRILSRQPFAP